VKPDYRKIAALERELGFDPTVDPRYLWTDEPGAVVYVDRFPPDLRRVDAILKDVYTGAPTSRTEGRS
jgi:hypothetical protein